MEQLHSSTSDLSGTPLEVQRSSEAQYIRMADESGAEAPAPSRAERTIRSSGRSTFSEALSEARAAVRNGVEDPESGALRWSESLTAAQQRTEDIALVFDEVACLADEHERRTWTERLRQWYSSFSSPSRSPSEASGAAYFGSSASATEPFLARTSAASTDVEIASSSYSSTDYESDGAEGASAARARRSVYALRPTSGYVRAGEMLAVLGPSGSGKTTLLDLLSGRKTRGTLSGTVQTPEWELQTEASDGEVLGGLSLGYVQQEDLLLAGFTVRETLVFAARLKMPRASESERLARVEDILAALDLTDAGDRQIGDAGDKTLSGGERRRLAIGIELITNPRVLILDEPTSGLDAYSAAKVIDVLVHLARGRSGRESRGTSVAGRVAVDPCAIVCTIHQPRSSIFFKFDRVLLLSRGHELFFGDTAHAIPYFNDLGWRPLRDENPADFLLDLLSAHNVLAADGTREAAVLEKLGLVYEPPRGEHALTAAVAAQPHVLAAQFAQSAAGKALSKIGRDVGFSNRVSRAQRPQAPSKHLSSRWRRVSGDAADSSPVSSLSWQLSNVMHREFVRTRRGTALLLANAAVHLVIAGFFGILLHDLDNASLEQNEVSKALGITLIINTGAIISFFYVPRFIKDRMVFHRERSAGMYGTLPFYVARIGVGIPLTILNVALFCAICYPSVELSQTWSQGGYFFVVFVAVALAFSALNDLVGAACRTEEVALALAGMASMVCLICCGTMVHYANMSWPMRLFYYSSPMTYAVSGLLVNEFQDSHMEFVKNFGVQVLSRWTNLALVLTIFVLYRIAGYFALRFLARPRR